MLDSGIFRTGRASVLTRLDRWCDVPGVSYAGGGAQTAPLGAMPVRIEFSTVDLFFTERPSHPGLPYSPQTLLDLTTREGFASVVEVVEPGHVRVHFDLPGVAWWFFSRYEELFIDRRDEHGRFLAAHSTLAPELYDLPLVTRWFERVEDLARELCGLSPLPETPATLAPIAVTHDLDLLRKFPRFSPRVLWRAHREGRLQECLQVLCGRRRDPYNALDALVQMHEETGAAGTWFLMSGTGTHPLDGDYRSDDERLRVLRSRKEADAFGLHGSYMSYRDDDMLYAEAAALQEAIGAKLSPITRQHYLRFQTPTTWLEQADAGFTLDATSGFADRCGFRNGWTGAFTPFHPQTGRELPITAVPLNVMDMTISRYEKLDEAAAMTRLEQIHRNAASRRGGVFVMLWHNTLADRHVHGNLWDVFDTFVRTNATARTRFTSLRNTQNESANGTNHT